jgi:hypothetical protein
MKIIPLIWFTFTILFACFSAYHFNQTRHSYPRFEWETIDSGGLNFIGPNIIETRKNLELFVKQWNDYIDQQNKSFSRINTIAAIGYLITAAMSFIAMLLPGPYKIKDTANYLYENLHKSSIFKKRD